MSPAVIINHNKDNFFYVIGGCEETKVKRYSKPSSFIYELEIDSNYDVFAGGSLPKKVCLEKTNIIVDGNTSFNQMIVGNKFYHKGLKQWALVNEECGFYIFSPVQNNCVYTKNVN